jgi:hypothetical protein
LTRVAKRDTSATSTTSTDADEVDDDESECGDNNVDEDAAKAEYEAASDDHVQGGDNGHDESVQKWDPETQPPDICKEEPIAIAMATLYAGWPLHPAS